MILDHQTRLNGRVLGAQYEDGAIEYIAQLDDAEITKQIEDGTIKHCTSKSRCPEKLYNRSWFSQKWCTQKFHVRFILEKLGYNRKFWG